jgi:hypothetical protein
MAFPGLNFLPGIGVEAAIRSRYGEPVNYFPIQGLKEFTLLVSVGRCKFKLSEQCIGFLLQATLGGVAVDFRPQSMTGFSSLWLLLEMLVFTFTSSDRICVSSTRSFSIFREMVVLTGIWSPKNMLKKNKANGQRFLARQSACNKSRMQISLEEDILMGANRVPIGNRLQRRSVFQRIQWPSAEFWAALL